VKPTADEDYGIDTVWESAPAQDTAGPWREVSLRRAEELVPLLKEVTVALTGLGCSIRVRTGVRLALEEVIVNGLRHGNRGDPSRCVRVRYRFGPDCVLAEVEDEGPGFDPNRVFDPTLPENWGRPRGRGLLLVRHFMTWVRFNGNRVTLFKRFPIERGRSTP
jgi:serine/threonine-protein kinase RsbW